MAASNHGRGQGRTGKEERSQLAAAAVPGNGKPGQVQAAVQRAARVPAVFAQLVEHARREGELPGGTYSALSHSFNA